MVLGQTDGYWAFRLLPAEVETNSKDGVPLQIAISQNGDLAAESPSESEIVQGPVEEQMNVPGEPLEPLGTVLDINQIELPELPDLPDLPDLADLPDLPSVPQAGEPLT